MAVNKTTGSNGLEQNNRLKWLRAKLTDCNGCGKKQQTQMPVDKIRRLK